MRTNILRYKYGFIFLGIFLFASIFLMHLQNEQYNFEISLLIPQKWENVKTIISKISSTRPKTKLPIRLMTVTSNKPSSRLKANISYTPSTRLMTTNLEKLKEKLKYVCVEFSGRLGNHMFQFASGLGIAKLNNRNLIVRTGLKYLQSLFNIHNIEKNTTLCKNAKRKIAAKACSFDPRLMNISNKGTVFVGLYLQSYKFFEHIFDEIRSQFTFKKEIKAKANNILKKIVENHKRVNENKSLELTIVGVHVRRGDFVNHKWGFNVPTKEYFFKAKQWFQSRYKNIIFVVCSNGLQWCKDNLSDNSTYFISGNSPAEDMAILSSCDHLISSVGTYSWWTGFLCKGNVTYSFPPAKENAIIRAMYSADYMDYFPPNWIRL